MSAVEAGWGALADGDWGRARRHFEEALALQERAEVFEGLSWVGECLDDETLIFESRERAYRLYRKQGDDRSAARVAAWLASDYVEFRGEAAVANGWLQRAHRLLDALEPGPDHGWLAVHEGAIALGVANDTGTARDLGAGAADLGRRFGVPELEMLGLALEGRAMVTEGDVSRGMRRLDEASAAALAGEATLLFCAAWTCCFLISACEGVRDYDRAGQWSLRVGEFCDRLGITCLLAFCRAYYGGVLTWQGHWEEAEAELTLAADRLLATRPAMAGDALVRLAELRRRQGRVDEAEALLARCEWHPLALAGRAALALEDGQAEEAAALADRFLRRFPIRNAPERCAGLEIAIRAHARLENHDRAGEALEELREVASRLGTPLLQAAALAGEGLIATAGGDHDTACRSLEDALDLLGTEAPFETALLRLDLAAALDALGRHRPARQEIEAAATAFRQLGAVRDATRAETMLAGLDGAAPTPNGPLQDLTRREREVLTLVAEGLTNHEIAERLVLSEHTVHRHVTNVLRKLGLPTRAAAASLAVRQGLA